MMSQPMTKTPSSTKSPHGMPGTPGQTPRSTSAWIASQIQAHVPKKGLSLVKGLEIRGYQAEFVFRANLREYLRLQNHAWRAKHTLLDDIRFISAGSDNNVLARPAVLYVRSAWGALGEMILDDIQDSLDGQPTAPRVFPNKDGRVSFQIHNNWLVMNIKAASSQLMAKVVEQVCWLTSVAGEGAPGAMGPLAHLRNYIKTNAKEREAVTVYMQQPQLRFVQARCDVSTPVRANQKMEQTEATGGQCWKAMVGVAIVTADHAQKVPRRPEGIKGLEAELPVLGALFGRACPPDGHVLVPQGPAAMWRPGSLANAEAVRAGGGGAKYPGIRSKRLIAENIEGSFVRWHFELDPNPAAPNALVDFHNATIERVLKHARMGFEADMIDVNARHVVGWSQSAGFFGASATAPAFIRRQPHRRLKKLTQYHITLTGFGANARPPGILACFGISLNLAVAERHRMPPAPTPEMPHDRLALVDGHYFLLCDPDRRCSWLLSGAAMALYVLRQRLDAYPHKEPDFDLARLNHMKDGNLSSAFQVLADRDNLERTIAWKLEKSTRPRPKGGNHDDASTGTSGSAVEQTETAVPLSLLVDDVLKVLVFLISARGSMDEYVGLSDAITKQAKYYWGNTIVGWKLDDVLAVNPANVYSCKLDSPNWLALAKELKPVVIFGAQLGEVLRPRAGTVCPHFPDVIPGHDVLAVGMGVLKSLVQRNPARARCGDVARLHRNVAWSVPEALNPSTGTREAVRPFGQTCACDSHRDQVWAGCFPLQAVEKIEKIPQKWIPGVHPNPDRWLPRSDFLRMESKHPHGVVVFGDALPQKKLQGLAKPVPAHGSRPSERPGSGSATGLQVKPALSEKVRGHWDAHRTAPTSSAPTTPTAAHARRVRPTAPAPSSRASSTTTVAAAASPQTPAARRPSGDGPRDRPGSSRGRTRASSPPPRPSGESLGRGRRSGDGDGDGRRRVQPAADVRRTAPSVRSTASDEAAGAGQTRGSSDSRRKAKTGEQ